MSKYIDGVNEGNMDKFLAALRSGKFGQATGTLCSVNHNDGSVQGYCCLGVGSELVFQEEEGTLIQRAQYEFGGVTYNGHHLLAPFELMEWLGIPEANVEHDSAGWNINFYKAEAVLQRDEYFGAGFTLSDETVSASEMNDDMELGFVAIADVFENEFIKENV